MLACSYRFLERCEALPPLRAISFSSCSGRFLKFLGLALPPLLAISFCFSGSIEAKPLSFDAIIPPLPSKVSMQVVIHNVPAAIFAFKCA